jgi:hypothetical protein
MGLRGFQMNIFLRGLSTLLKTIFLFLGFGWLALCLAIGLDCELGPRAGTCFGANTDVWLPAFFSGLIGVPALIISVGIVAHFFYKNNWRA